MGLVYRIVCFQYLNRHCTNIFKPTKPPKKWQFEAQIRHSSDSLDGRLKRLAVVHYPFYTYQRLFATRKKQHWTLDRRNPQLILVFDFLSVLRFTACCFPNLHGERGGDYRRQVLTRKSSRNDFSFFGFREINIFDELQNFYLFFVCLFFFNETDH